MKISLFEQVIWRFIESGLASAFSTAGVVTVYTGVQTWEQFQSATAAMALSLLIGFIAGVLMAIRKYFAGASISVDSIESSNSLVG